MGETLVGLRTDLDGRIVYSAVTREDLRRTGAIPPDTEDLVDFTMSVRGVEVGLLFIEQKRGGIKLSLRTRLDSFHCAGRLAVRRRRPPRRGRRDPARPALRIAAARARRGPAGPARLGHCGAAPGRSEWPEARTPADVSSRIRISR